jgi:hypothetical protein
MNDFNVNSTARLATLAQLRVILTRLSGLDPPKIFFSAQVVDLQASNFQKSPKEAVVKT